MKLWHRKVARAFVFDEEKRVFLIVKGSLPPFNFHLPGGGIDKGESAEAAVRREIREELNILPENIVSLEYLHKAYETVLFIPHEMEIFLVKVKNVSLKISWELSKTKWIKPEELSDYFDKSVIGEVRGLI